jgi:beta-galactosidase
VKSLGDYAVHLIVRQDGRMIRNMPLPRIPLPAGRDTVISLKPWVPALKPRSEYLADIHFTLPEKTPWAPKGFEIASNQFALTAPLRPAAAVHAGIPLLRVKDTAFVVSGKGFRIRIGRKNGALDSYVWNGTEQIYAPLLPHFTRPLTDNDRHGWKPQVQLAPWYHPHRQLISSEADTSLHGLVQVKSRYQLIGGKATVTVTYTVDSRGVVRVDEDLHPADSLPDLPKVGMQCGIYRPYDDITWYGRGPCENYIDKNYGLDASIYTLPIMQFMEPYVMPQENGNRTDVRWMFLSDSTTGKGLLVAADSLLSMSAWPYTEANINAAKHTFDLKDAGFITLNIDLKQMGVGGNTSWNKYAAPVPKYRIPARHYHYGFYLFPCNMTADLSELVKKIRFKIPPS